MIADPEASPFEVEHEYGLKLNEMEEIKEVDALIIAVGHKVFLDLTEEAYFKMFKKKSINKKVLFDIKGILDKNVFEFKGYIYWRL
jgi:UDP-N-acetyl-D-galactosamine dehydrogenase